MARGQLVATGLFLSCLATSASAQVPVPCSFESLTRLGWPELEQLYRQSEPGVVPRGLARGRAIYSSDQAFSGAKAACSRMVWRGKFFKDNSTMINQWCCCKATPARVCYGPSWLDCKPSIILDYHGMARVIWTDVRDEIREVAPGLYIGAMFRRGAPEKYEVLFVLEAAREQHR
jgi:hypothetical protein